MKKFKLLAASALILALACVASVMYADNGGLANHFLSDAGGSRVLTNHQVFGLGRYGGANDCLTVPFVTDVNLVYGQPVVIDTSTTNGVSVSGTTTVADMTVIGFADFPTNYAATCTTCTTYAAPAGSIVQVAVGGVISAYVGVNVTKGDKLVTSANSSALYLTGSAAGSGAAFTQLSQTAVVGIALDTVTLSGGATSATARVLILK